MVIGLNEVRDRASLSLSRMSSVVEETLQMAVQALRTQDHELARKVIDQDDIIDNYQIVIEEEVARMATYESPTAMEYRRQVALIKIAGDLERIGDYATNIAETVLKLKNEKFIKPIVHIPQLSSLAVTMLSTALKAFVERNSDLAEAVCKRDDEADELYEHISAELGRVIGLGVDQQGGRQALLLLLVAEWLERAADHATNIGEETVYVVTGKRIKY